MTTTFATRDEIAAERIRTHHTHLTIELEQLVRAVGSADDQSFPRVRDELVTWLRTELAPHAAGEEHTFYRAAERTVAGRLLIAGMVAEHGVILGLVDEVASVDDQRAAATWAEALLRVFRSHAAKENDLVLPLLVDEPTVDLHALLEEMHGHH